MTSLSADRTEWIEDFMLDNFACVTTVQELVASICNMCNNEIPYSMNEYELYQKLKEEDEERISWILRNTFSSF